MSDDLGKRLAGLRARRAISAKELAHHTGVPYSDLVRLEAGAAKPPSKRTVRRLAEYFQTSEEYLLTGKEPGPDSVRSGFLRYYDQLDEQDRSALKFAPIERRVEAVLTWMELAYPACFTQAQLAARLGYSPASLADILRGSAPLGSHLLKRLTELTGLAREFFVRGDFFGGAAASSGELDPERLQLYYEVVCEAIAAGISPGELRTAVRILAVRGPSGQ